MALAFAGSALAAESAPERYIVTYKPGVNMSEAARALTIEKTNRIHHRFDDTGGMAATLSKAEVKTLRADPNVVSVEIDPPRYPMAQTQPYGIGMVGAPTAWAAGHDGNGVMVCVIDSGIKADHEDFSGLDIRGGYPTGWNSDSCGHGTHVAGTIAAQDNTTGVVGVATGGLSMYFVQVFSGASCGWSYASDLIDAANRCKTAADSAGKKLVISMSLGGGGSSTAENNGFQNLYNQGVLSIAAAGNDGNSTMSYPASYNSVMSVAAIDSNKAVADFSQFNSQVEIAAPGVGVLSTYPISEGGVSFGSTLYSASAMDGSPSLSRSGQVVDGGTCESSGSWSGRVVLCQRGNISFADKVLNAQSGGATAAIVYNNVSGGFGGTLNGTSTSIPSVSMSMEDGLEIKNTRLGQTATVSTIAQTNVSAYATLDGTSMATPHVSGSAAVIWSSNLSASNADVRSAITSTAEDLGSNGRDNYYGYGLIDIPAAIAALGGPAPDTTPPSTVSSLSASSAGTSVISLSWSSASDTGGSGLAGYKIERCTGASCTSYTQIATTTSTSYSNSGLAEGTTYRYRVRAYDGAGNNGGYSSVASATTDTTPVADTTPPSTVSSLSASAGGTSSVSLSWSSATDTGGSGLAGYKVERCTGASCTSYAQIATTTSTSYNNTGLSEGTTYRYRVRAYDGAGNNGGYSSVVSATTDTTPPPTGNVLANGVPVTGLSGSTGATVFYTMDVPAGASNLSFAISGGSGDADLYVRFGSDPTTSSYDCRPYLNGNNETCSFATPQAGTYHVMLRAYSTYSGVSLVGSYTEGGGGGGGNEPSFFENTTNVTIVDRGTVYSDIAVAGRTGNAPSDLQVSVDIIHTYVGDLRLRLYAPDGTYWTLRDRQGGSADDTHETYTVNASGEVANGTWRLQVYDRYRGDVGYIDGWSMDFGN